MKKFLSILTMGSILAAGFFFQAHRANATVLTDNLIGYWNFDENSGTTAADSVGGNTATLHGATLPTWTTGQIGSALQYSNADGSFASTSASASLNVSAATSLTINAWVKMSATQTSNASVLTAHHISGGQPSYYIAKNYGNNNLKFGMYGGGYVLVFKTGSWNVVADDTWHMLTVEADSSTGMLYMYVDGSLYDSGTPGAYGFAGSQNVYINFGANGAGNAVLNGTVDEVGVWTRPLTSTELSDLYNAGGGSSYPFSGGTPTPLSGTAVIFGGSTKIKGGSVKIQ